MRKYQGLASTIREQLQSRNKVKGTLRPTDAGKEKFEIVGRPDTATDPTDVNSTLSRQGQIKAKKIDEVSKKTLNSYLDKTAQGVDAEPQQTSEYPSAVKFRGRLLGKAVALRKLGKKIPEHRAQPTVNIKATEETVTEADIPASDLSKRIAQQKTAREDRDGTPEERKSIHKAKVEAVRAHRMNLFDKHITKTMHTLKTEPNIPLEKLSSMFKTATKLMSKPRIKEEETLIENDWEYEDARGVKQKGKMEKYIERQGSDHTAFMKRQDGTLDLVSGSRLKQMKKINSVVKKEETLTELEAPVEKEQPTTQAPAKGQKKKPASEPESPTSNEPVKLGEVTPVDLKPQTKDSIPDPNATIGKASSGPKIKRESYWGNWKKKTLGENKIDDLVKSLPADSKEQLKGIMNKASNKSTILVVKKGSQDVKRVPKSDWSKLKATHNMAEAYTVMGQRKNPDNKIVKTIGKNNGKGHYIMDTPHGTKKVYYEDEETVNEVSKRKLVDYLGNAVHSYGSKRSDITANIYTNDTKQSNKAFDKALKRHSGIQLAAGKLAGKYVRVAATEETVNEAPEKVFDQEKYKVGDIVVPKIGPHKGVKHEVIFVHSQSAFEGKFNIRPIGLRRGTNRYRLGAAMADDLQVDKAVNESSPSRKEPKSNWPGAKVSDAQNMGQPKIDKYIADRKEYYAQQIASRMKKKGVKEETLDELHGKDKLDLLRRVYHNRKKQGIDQTEKLNRVNTLKKRAARANEETVDEAIKGADAEGLMALALAKGRVVKINGKVINKMPDQAVPRTKATTSPQKATASPRKERQQQYQRQTRSAPEPVTQKTKQSGSFLGHVAKSIAVGFGKSLLQRLGAETEYPDKLIEDKTTPAEDRLKADQLRIWAQKLASAQASASGKPVPTKWRSATAQAKSSGINQKNKNTYKKEKHLLAVRWAKKHNKNMKQESESLSELSIDTLSKYEQAADSRLGDTYTGGWRHRYKTAKKATGKDANHLIGGKLAMRKLIKKINEAKDPEFRIDKPELKGHYYNDKKYRVVKRGDAWKKFAKKHGAIVENELIFEIKNPKTTEDHVHNILVQHNFSQVSKKHLKEGPIGDKSKAGATVRTYHRPKELCPLGQSEMNAINHKMEVHGHEQGFANNWFHRSKEHLIRLERADKDDGSGETAGLNLTFMHPRKNSIKEETMNEDSIYAKYKNHPAWVKQDREHRHEASNYYNAYLANAGGATNKGYADLKKRHGESKKKLASLIDQDAAETKGLWSSNVRNEESTISWAVLKRQLASEATHSRGGGAKRVGQESGGDDHIIAQLRNAKELGSHNVKFKDKQSQTIDRDTANAALDHYAAQKTADQKLASAERLGASHKSFKDALAGKPVVASSTPNRTPSMPFGFKPKGLPTETGANRTSAPAGGRTAKRISRIAEPKNTYRPD